MPFCESAFPPCDQNIVRSVFEVAADHIRDFLAAAIYDDGAECARGAREFEFGVVFEFAGLTVFGVIVFALAPWLWRTSPWRISPPSSTRSGG